MIRLWKSCSLIRQNRNFICKSSHLKPTTLVRSGCRYSSSITSGNNDKIYLGTGVGILTVSGALVYSLFTSPLPQSNVQYKDFSKTEVAEEPVISKPNEIETIVDTEEIKEIIQDSSEVGEVEKVEEPQILIKDLKLPSEVPYLIIGAGTAAHSACRAIQKREPNAKILIIGNEDVLPYMRPPLSKELWFNPDENSESLSYKAWNGKERSVFFEDSSYYTSIDDLESKGGVSVVTGKNVTSIDALGHSITLENGQKIKYAKLLIATGGKPKQHPAFKNINKENEHITMFRDVNDLKKLKRLLRHQKDILIVGGGFLGSELACALSTYGKQTGINVTQIYNEDGNMAKVLPKYLSEWTTKKVNKEGVLTMPNRSIQTVNCGEKVEVTLDNNEKLIADHVIVCVGLEPSTELSVSSGLEVDKDHGGFRVNSELEARSDIWVAGDAACFYDISLGRRRVEHHDHAVVSGKLAGENMTGAKKSYHHQSMFWSDLGPEVGYEAIGIVDSSLPTVGVWAKATLKDNPKVASEESGENIRSDAQSPDVTVEAETISQQAGDDFGKGVVFYMKEKKIVGVLLWNIFGHMPVARKLISDSHDHEDLNAVAKLFHLHPNS